MMSKEVNHLHPIAMIISFFASLKSIIIPGIVILLGRGFHYSLYPDSQYFINTLITFAIIFFVIFFILMTAIIKWKRFVYWFEDEELRIEYGLFVKKKRYIPFERIQSLNYKEGIYHRLFKLVKVSIETAADSGGKSEADLIAITRAQAEAIEQEMKKTKLRMSQQSTQEQGIDQKAIVSEPTELETNHSIIHHMSTKDLLILATTSSGIGVVFSGLAAITSQFDDWIPYERIYGELQSFIRFGVFMIVIAVLIFLLVSWVVSVVITFVNHYGFTVEKEEDKLFISKGLLEKKRITIPMKRIQGIRIVENPLRQLFGYATVVIESAGSSGEKGEQKIVMLPLVKKRQGVVILEKLFPEEQWHLPLHHAPKRALLRYMFRHLYWLTPIVAVVSYITFPYGLWSILLLPLALLLGIWQHRSAGYAISNQQLTIVYRGVSKITFVTSKKRLQAISLSQSYFAKRRDLATITVHIMSGLSGSMATIKHFDQVTLEKVFEWYRPKSHGSIDAKE